MNHFKKLTANRVRWYHSAEPLTKEEQSQLIKKFGFYEHHLASTKQGKTPRPKISSTKKYTYFVFHIPYKPSNSSRFFICDLNIFLTNNALVTIQSQGHVPSLQRYFDSAASSKRIRSRRFKHGSANLFLNLMKYILNETEDMIDRQGELVDSLDSQIFKTYESSEFIEMVSLLRYNQVVASSALDRQSRMLEYYSGEKSPMKSMTNASEHKWGDIVETFQTLSYELNADIEHLEGLVKTFETLVTHRTNETIKVLTIFSVVLLPLTLISGIYGMNFTVIPLANHPYGFFITLLGMGFMLGGLLLLFKWRKWL